MRKRTHNVVCLLPVRNGAADLPGYFESVSRFTDAVVALDDGSTDDTARILKAHPLVKMVLSNPRRETYAGWDDSGNRNRLLEAAGSLDPDWIFSLDADERIGPDDAQALSGFLGNGAVRGAAYGFLVHRMIGDLQSYDPSYEESTFWAYRLFAYRKGQRFPAKRLHFVPIPTDIPRGHWAKTSIRIQHLSSLTEEKRKARFQKYVEADPGCDFQESYKNVLKDPGNPMPWREREPGQPVLLNGKRHDGITGHLAEHHVYHDDLDPDRPALSAIVISQNDVDRIEEVMEALVRQKTDQPFEVILVNSGNDGTAELVRERFPQVRVIHLPEPALPGKARNEGMKVARGEVLSFPGSHVVVPPGSLQHRIDAHQMGFAMVNGSVINGTPTLAGWASYFLDHSMSLPTRPSEILRASPSRCSYLRGPLEAIGGFPEDRRAGEDTVVNNKLFALGHKAYRYAKIGTLHRSPCRNSIILLKHHFSRGFGFGRLLWEYPGPKKNIKFRFRRIRFLMTRYPVKRLRSIIANVLRYGKPMRRQFIMSLPLIVAGTFSAALGAAVYLLSVNVRTSMLRRVNRLKHSARTT
jgi:glycosyltransferase involved in cell wall biosynthesis